MPNFKQTENQDVLGQIQGIFRKNSVQNVQYKICLVPMHCFCSNMHHILGYPLTIRSDLPFKNSIKICSIERLVHIPDQLLFARLTV